MYIFNKIDDALDQGVDGFLSAHPGEFVKLPGLYTHTVYKKEIEDRVQVVISGGGGYGPLFGGFVGDGLADATCQGDFDCAPNAYSLYEVAKTIDQGKGILFLTNNFTGDYLNNDMAQELLQNDGIDSRVCYASDDIFSASGEDKSHRGGLSGIGLLIKTAAGAVATGLSLEQAFGAVEMANSRLRSVTVCLDEQNKRIEFGAGFSGEPPVAVYDFVSADDLVERALGHLMPELGATKNERICISVSRLKRMSYLEGYVVLQSVKRRLEELGKTVECCSSGGYFDVFDRNGCIISLIAADDELVRYILPTSRRDFSI